MPEINPVLNFKSCNNKDNIVSGSGLSRGIYILKLKDNLKNSAKIKFIKF